MPHPRNGTAVPAARDDWHTRPATTVAADLHTSASTGLPPEQVQARRQEFGPNSLPRRAPRPWWLRLLLQIHNPLIYVLLVAGIVTLALQDYVDSAVIFGVILINAAIGFIQEGKAERALDAVRNMLALHANVIRNGERQQIDAAELVPGDIVLLESGDKVPADLRLLYSRNLRAVESALTGESVPVEKNVDAVGADASLGDRTCMMYSGTLIACGQGCGVVIATGSHTELGRIGTLVSDVETLATPLTRRLDQFARQISAAIVAIGIVTFLYGRFVAEMPTLDIFLAVVGLAVAAIPEGLPAVVTIVLAIGTRTMARNRAIVRRLPAVETLGSVSVICSDKTGTLTRNEMTTVRLMFSDRDVSVSGSGYGPEGGFQSHGQHLAPHQDTGIQHLSRCALLCNDARIRPDSEGNWQLYGDPTEGALVTLAHKAGLDSATLTRQYPRLDAIPFESERRFMATLNHDHQGHHLILLKGAPERILPLCTHQTGSDSLDTDYWLAAIERAASAGERVLALAQCSVDNHLMELALEDIHPRFELLGLVGIIDPPRDEAIAAVAECQRAGIRIKMITGDHAGTAAAIGARLGLNTRQPLTGDMIAQLDDAALTDRVLATDVIARASPEDKLRLVAALQAAGHLVAMTGDGVNDAPALKAADIGVAMGHKGTDAAREASDLVLTDDNFATIAQAVREGRVVFDNIKKSLLFMLPTNVGEAMVILLAIFAGLALPVTAGQILWVNMITAVTLAMALAFEPAEAGVMLRDPRPAQEALITRALGIRILFVSALMAAATFAIFEWEMARGGSLEMARTAAVNMLVMGELVYLFNSRRFTASGLTLATFTGNPVALWVCGVLVIMQLLFTYAPPLQHLFQSTGLEPVSWAVIGGLAVIIFLAVEAEKALWRRRGVVRM